MDNLEEQIHNDLRQYLLSVKEIDARLPECPDVEGKWETIANAYIPDGVREFQNYPLASLGWMMYIGAEISSNSQRRTFLRPKNSSVSVLRGCIMR